MAEIGPDDGPSLVLRDDRDGVSVLTINRLGQRNAMVYESWLALGAQLELIRQAEHVRAVVLVGAGGFFGAGGDIKTRPAHGIGPLAPAGRVEQAQEVMSLVRALPVPVVAAVEVAAIGLSWSLALSCDLIIAGTDSYFAAPFVSRSVVPDGGLAWQLTRQLGRHRASDLLLGGGRLLAKDAVLLGLVNETVDPGKVLVRALAVADALAAADQGAVELTKRLINAAEGDSAASFRPLELALAVVAQERLNARPLSSQ